MAMARKSQAYATGAPWKLPLDSTRPSPVMTGLSTADASSRNAIVRAYSTVGEMCDVLRDVWGEYEEEAVI